MVNQQLLDYIKQQVQQGTPSDTIKKSLITSGWQEVDVNEAFTALTPETPVVQVPTPPVSAIPQSDTPPSKKKKWIKGIVITVISLITLNYTFYYLPHILNLFTKDIPSLEYSDIQLQKVVVNDNDNAYFDLQKIEKVLYYPKEASTTISNISSGKEWDDQFVNDLMSRNQETFTYITQAAGKPKFQLPQFSDPENISVNSTNIPANLYLNINRIEMLHAMYLAKQGKTKEAMDETFNLLSIGQKIEDSQANVISYLIALALKTGGLITMQKIISTSTTTSDELKQYSNNLNQYSDDKKGLIEALKVENHIYISNIDSLYSGLSEVNTPFKSMESKSNFIYYLKPDKTKKLSIDNTRAEISALDEPCSKIFPVPEKLISDDGNTLETVASYLKLYFTENAIGKLYFTAVGNTPFQSLRCKMGNLPFKATQVLIGIKEFNNDNGKLPSTLDELVPNYLPSIPLDPYDGKPLRYSKEKKIIYSVGTSTEDIGGSDGDVWKWSTMKNPTFRFDF